MSANVGNYIDCPNLQDMLNTQFGQLNGNMREPSPFTEYLVSPMNTQGVVQNQLTGGSAAPGHKRIVQLRYENRFDEGDVSSSAVQSCSGGSKPGETSKTYEIDETAGSSYPWTIALSDLVGRCEDDASFFARQVQKAIDVLVRKINTDNLTKAATLKGKFATSHATTAKTISTLLSSGAYNPNAIEQIRFEFFRMLYYGQVMAFSGSDKFFNYFQSMNGACCNTTLGVDLAALFQGKNIGPLFDRKVETAFGTDHVLAMAHGALQFITYNEYVGPGREMNTDTYKQGIITDPVTGINFDYLASFNCGTWNFQVKLAHDLVGLPNDLFSASDNLTGVTWVNDFHIVNS